MRSLPASGGGELPTPRTFQAYAFEQPSSPHTQALRMSAASTNHNERVLLADIGGTNARFALADTSSATPLLVDSVEGFAVADFPSLADAARHYLDQTGATAQNGVFAVAGRVDGDEARITNHPWVISLSRTRKSDPRAPATTGKPASCATRMAP